MFHRVCLPLPQPPYHPKGGVLGNYNGNETRALHVGDPDQTPTTVYSWITSYPQSPRRIYNRHCLHVATRHPKVLEECSTARYSTYTCTRPSSKVHTHSNLFSLRRSAQIKKSVRARTFSRGAQITLIHLLVLAFLRDSPFDRLIWCLPPVHPHVCH